MDEIGLVHRPKRKPNGITKADREARKSDDLLKREFKADKPLEKCVTDITEIKAKDGKLYVSAIFDCFDSSVLGLATSISVIDKLFFGKMAELGESCYFNTKQCVAAWLVLSGMINVMILFLIAGYLNYHWSVGLLQVGLYILTPYLVSSITALGILSMETRGKNSSLFGMSAIFLSISYGVIGSIPRALFVTTLWIWAVAFLVSGLLFVMQIKKLLSKMEKGEVLCTN